MQFILVAVAVFLLSLEFSVGFNFTAQSSKYVYDSLLPDRLQWINNDGYCGEVSVVMAMLKYGGYMSQFDVRDISTLKSGTQQTYYLVGENDQLASKNLKLSAIEYDHDVYDSKAYLAWVKTMVRKGYAVTITVFMNNYLFYGMTNPDAGFPDYDHIVSVEKIESNYDDDLYHDDDIITMSDHGLWAPEAPGPPYPYPFDAPYYFSYTMKEFQKTRQEANKRTAGVYSLPISSSRQPFEGNFGITHSGILDDEQVTLPIHVGTNVNYEAPQIKRKSDIRPEPMEITLSISVSELEEGVSYMLYKYDDVSKVPTSMFNANRAKSVSSVPITVSKGISSFGMTETIMSNEQAHYRCVRTDSS